MPPRRWERELRDLRLAQGSVAGPSEVYDTADEQEVFASATDAPEDLQVNDPFESSLSEPESELQLPGSLFTTPVRPQPVFAPLSRARSPTHARSSPTPSSDADSESSVAASLVPPSSTIRASFPAFQPIVPTTVAPVLSITLQSTPLPQVALTMTSNVAALPTTGKLMMPVRGEKTCPKFDETDP